MGMFDENRGVYGYKDSKSKKLRDAAFDASVSSDDGVMSNADKEYLTDMALGMEESKRALGRKAEHYAAIDNADMSQYYMNSQKSHLVPEDTEERRRRVFATSPKVVEGALNDYYKNTFAPIHRAKRTEADKIASDAYRRYATVPGANPHTALGVLNAESDPLRTLDNTMHTADGGELDKIAERYARYAGLSPQEYRQIVLEPALRNRAIGDLVDENTPKSGIEYFGRGAWRNSLLGGLSDLAEQGYSRSYGKRFINDAAMENYNASRGERLAAGVGGLLLDSGIFAGIGSVASKATGSATSLVAKQAASRMLAKGAANGMTREMAEQTVKNSMINSLSTKIVQSSMNQGITLGAYDAAHSVVDDLLHGENIDGGKALGAFGRGAATGAALGVVGTPLKVASRGLTGGRKLAASAGVLSAESAVFTGMGQIEKASSGIEIEPIDLVNDFGDSMATLLAMRMFHWKPSGAAEKLNSVGRLKQEFRFTMPERKQIAAAGIDPDQFISNLEKSLNIYSKNSGKAAENVKEDYLRLMSNEELTPATRSKLLYIVENKLSSTPPDIVDYEIRSLDGGNYEMSLYDAEGRKIETIECEGQEGLKSALFTKTGNLRRNRIANYEHMLTRSYDSQNFFRQAGIYAKETGMNIDAISDAMYRKAMKEPVSDGEQAAIDEILRRSNYNDSEVGQLLYMLRRSLEQKYNLNEGSLLSAIEKSSFHCSKNENAALNEYEKMMEAEVKALYAGTSAERSRILSREDARYQGLGNEELKEQEKKDYIIESIKTGRGPNEGSIPTISEKYGMFADGLRKPPYWDPRYVWNVSGIIHTKKSIEESAVEVKRFAKELGCDIKVICDEEELPMDDVEYTLKLRARGWYDRVNDKVVINLPNNISLNEMKKTVVHEVVGHRGLSKLFGNYYYDFMEEVYQRGSKEVRDGIDFYRRSYGSPSYYTGVDEYLARLVEKTSPTPEQRNILQRLRDFVRDMLRRMNLYGNRTSVFSESDLTELLARHHQAVRMGKTPDSYRRTVFGDFESASRGKRGYYDWNVTNKRFLDDYYNNPTQEGRDPVFHNDRREIYEELYGAIPNGNSNNSYRFAGEEAAENFEHTDFGYNIQENLARAKQMAKSGNPARTIKVLTGWELGNDGKWRYELNDRTFRMEIKDYVYRTLNIEDSSLAKTYIKIRKKPSHMRTKEEREFYELICSREGQFDNSATLGDILTDWALFGACPQAENIPVVFKNLGEELCLYDAITDKMYIDKRAFGEPSFETRMLMETQRIIQKHSGFPLAVNMSGAIGKDHIDLYREIFRWANNIRKNKIHGIVNSTTLGEMRRFEETFGLSYDEFLERFPTINEFGMFQTFGIDGANSGDVELRNMLKRRDMSWYETHNSPAEKTEDYPRSKQYNIRDAKDFEFLVGPLDIIDENMRMILNGGTRYTNEPDSWNGKAPLLRDAEELRSRENYDRYQIKEINKELYKIRKDAIERKGTGKKRRLN